MAKLTDSRDFRRSGASCRAGKSSNGKLHREYKFADFAHAFGFMATAAPTIEKNDHHPEWANVYNKVTVDLTTHSAGGITQKDLDLAALLEGIAKQLS